MHIFVYLVYFHVLYISVIIISYIILSVSNNKIYYFMNNNFNVNYFLHGRYIFITIIIAVKYRATHKNALIAGALYN